VSDSTAGASGVGTGEGVKVAAGVGVADGDEFGLATAAGVDGAEVGVDVGRGASEPAHAIAVIATSRRRPPAA
jgi:hypothetical protein